MRFEQWCIVAGALFILIALTGTLLKKLPLTTSLFYLGFGYLFGPAALGYVNIDATKHAHVLERVVEIAVLISLFTAGLKLRVPFRDKKWLQPLALASVSMVISVGLVAFVGTYVLNMPPGAAILLGAILAPTDPVLASDVQVQHATDQDRLRFTLTGEAGLNDGTAFPFVMLGLGLLGLHDLGDFGWKWFAVDVIWASAAGLFIGAVLGAGVAKLVLYLRQVRKTSVGYEDFLGLGLIALSYGIALEVHAYGFLAVFAAGLALRLVERSVSGEKMPKRSELVALEKSEISTHSDNAPAFMANEMLLFNEYLERIVEIVVVLLIGSLFSFEFLTIDAFVIIGALFFVIRPLSVGVGLGGTGAARMQRWLMGWFGIRGVGSIYYLMYALSHGLPKDIASRITGITLAVVLASAIFHGVSVTPLMNFYLGRMKKMG